ncbi:MAG: GDP-L-fucose synthase [Chlamydiales bacterium]
MLDPNQTVLIAGAGGMVGKALTRHFYQKGYRQLLIPSRQELDYTDQQKVRQFLKKYSPDVVVIAAAKVGGIWANMTYPAEFIYTNLMIACNLIHECHQANIDRLLFLGSTCIYPKNAPQPIVEEALLTSPLEKTNEAYAIAKIGGIKLCQFYRQQYGRHYISAMPTNLYGPGDSYHLENGHVIPSLILRFHQAKQANQPHVKMWGTGKVQREFLYVEDLAEGCFLLLQKYDEPTPINIGSHEEVTIFELAQMISEVVEYKGDIVTDLSKPDGIARKKTDLTRISRMGWSAKTSLKEGLRLSYQDFLKNSPYAKNAVKGVSEGGKTQATTC